MEQDYKCLCGYKYQKEWNKEPIVGDEPFKKLGIDGHPIYVRKESEYENDEKIRLIACPKCGTVKIGDTIW